MTPGATGSELCERHMLRQMHTSKTHHDPALFACSCPSQHSSRLQQRWSALQTSHGEQSRPGSTTEGSTWPRTSELCHFVLGQDEPVQGIGTTTTTRDGNTLRHHLIPMDGARDPPSHVLQLHACISVRHQLGRAVMHTRGGTAGFRRCGSCHALSYTLLFTTHIRRLVRCWRRCTVRGHCGVGLHAVENGRACFQHTSSARSDAGAKQPD